MWKRFAGRALALTTLWSVAACATASPAPSGDFCLLAEPIRLTAAEWQALSEASLRAIERHNAAGAALCDW